jgi:hypothetical protein
MFKDSKRHLEPDTDPKSEATNVRSPADKPAEAMALASGADSEVMPDGAATATKADPENKDTLP